MKAAIRMVISSSFIFRRHHSTRIRREERILRLLSAFVLVLLAPPDGRAQIPVADFFRGKTITLVVATGAGNGIDLLARIVAAHLGAHLPGNPSVIVRNMPGAGGMVGLQHLFAVARKDGTEIGTIESGVILSPIFGSAATKVDVTKFGWLGSVSQDTGTVVAWTASGVNSIADAKVREVVAGAAAATQSAGQFPALANATLGTRFRTVFGYAGASQVDLAMERREVDVTLRTLTSLRATRGEWVRDGKVRMILQLGPAKNPTLPDVPWFDDLAGSEEDRAMIRLVSTQYLLSRPYLAPPGLPADRLLALRKGFDETMHDPEFVAKANVYSHVMPVNAAELSAALVRIYSTPRPIIEGLERLTHSQEQLEQLQRRQHEGP